MRYDGMQKPLKTKQIHYKIKIMSFRSTKHSITMFEQFSGENFTTTNFSRDKKVTKIIFILPDLLEC